MSDIADHLESLAEKYYGRDGCDTMREAARLIRALDKMRKERHEKWPESALRDIRASTESFSPPPPTMGGGTSASGVVTYPAESPRERLPSAAGISEEYWIHPITVVATGQRLWIVHAPDSSQVSTHPTWSQAHSAAAALNRENTKHQNPAETSNATGDHK